MAAIVARRYRRKLACLGFVARCGRVCQRQTPGEAFPLPTYFLRCLVCFPVYAFGKLGRLGNLLVQSYKQPFAKLFILLERLNLLEKRNLPKLLKLERLITPFLNQIKKRLRLLKLRLLEFELEKKTQRLPVELFLLTKLKLLLLTLSLLTLPNPKKRPPRRDGGDVARRHD